MKSAKIGLGGLTVDTKGARTTSNSKVPPLGSNGKPHSPTASTRPLLQVNTSSVHTTELTAHAVYYYLIVCLSSVDSRTDAIRMQHSCYKQYSACSSYDELLLLRQGRSLMAAA
jgi:hypothetical protein